MKKTTSLISIHPSINLNQFFCEQGFWFAKRLVSPQLCRRLKLAFANEVKSYGGPLQRASWPNEERNHFSGIGAISNPLLNVHELEEERFPAFSTYLNSLLNTEKLGKALQAIMGTQAVLAESTYHESGFRPVVGTDGIIMDTTISGQLVACIIALEDTPPQVESLYVYPKSHKLKFGEYPSRVQNMMEKYEQISSSIMEKQCLGNQYLDAREISYAQALLQTLIKEAGLTKFQPAMQAGDVLFF